MATPLGPPLCREYSYRSFWVDRRAAEEVALAWLLTFPGCGAVGYWSARLFLAAL